MTEVEQTKEKIIEGKRFSVKDLQVIADIFESEAKLSDKGKRQYEISFEIYCQNMTRYESKSSRRILEDAMSERAPTEQLEFRFHDYNNRRHLRFSLSNGFSNSSYFRAGGKERRWVNDSFTRLSEKLELVESSKNWLIKHYQLTDFLISLLLGVCAINLMALILAPFALNISEELKDSIRAMKWFIFMKENPTLVEVFSWVCTFISGAGIWYGFLRNWFWSAWPNVEIGLGPEHLRCALVRRKRLVFLGASVLLPIVLSVAQHMITR
ncbi:MAG: hypothetical protein GY847_25385 [Proteobacteria bacterium]|nr:hypothetical protein [Pseudomonadota bacterium]